MAATVLRNGIDRLPNGNWFRPLFSKHSVSPPLHTVLEALKAHFYPRCNARLDLISCNTKFPDNLKLSKIVFLNSHHGHIVNCFTVNIFSPFVILQFPYSILNFVGKNPKKIFLSVTLGSLRTLWTESAKRTTFKCFHFLEALEHFK